MFYIVPGTTFITDQSISSRVIRNGIVNENLTTVSIGNDGSEIVWMDLEKAPHVLIAGTTGSGKSVCINTMLFELLSKNTPETLALYVIDPKMVDYVDCKYIPHTKAYETELDGAERILRNVKAEMMRRYKVMQQQRVKHASKAGIKQHIVVVFDEYASLMSPEGKAILQPLMNDIARLGRAAKVSMVLATQYPSSEVINSQLKANCPTRICFRVASATNSRVVLDKKGGENLNGCGDGIIVTANGRNVRFQGAIVPDESMEKMFRFVEPQPFRTWDDGVRYHNTIA